MAPQILGDIRDSVPKSKYWGTCPHSPIGIYAHSPETANVKSQIELIFSVRTHLGQILAVFDWKVVVFAAEGTPFRESTSFRQFWMKISLGLASKSRPRIVTKILYFTETPIRVRLTINLDWEIFRGRDQLRQIIFQSDQGRVSGGASYRQGRPRPRPYHFRLGPTSGPATRPGSKKK